MRFSLPPALRENAPLIVGVGGIGLVALYLVTHPAPPVDPTYQEIAAGDPNFGVGGRGNPATPARPALPREPGLGSPGETAPRSPHPGPGPGPGRDLFGGLARILPGPPVPYGNRGLAPETYETRKRWSIGVIKALGDGRG